MSVLEGIAVAMLKNALDGKRAQWETDQAPNTRDKGSNICCSEAERKVLDPSDEREHKPSSFS